MNAGTVCCCHTNAMKCMYERCPKTALPTQSPQDHKTLVVRIRALVRYSPPSCKLGSATVVIARHQSEPTIFESEIFLNKQLLVSHFYSAIEIFVYFCNNDNTMKMHIEHIYILLFYKRQLPMSLAVTLRLT